MLAIFSVRPRALIVGVLLVLAALVVESADAQRRRRRPRRAQETQQAQPDAGVSSVNQNPFDVADAGAIPSPRNDAGALRGSDEAPAAGSERTAAAPATGGRSVDDPPIEAAPDLTPLRAEYTSLVDDIVQLRSRVAVVGQQLFRTKVRVTVHNRAGDGQTLERVVMSLDGASIFRGDAAAVGGDDGRKVFEGFAAPGPHQVTVEVEQRSRANDAYRYTIRDTYRFEVLRDRVTEVTVVLDDDSEIAEDFPDDGEGEYDVRTRVRVATRELEDR